MLAHSFLFIPLYFGCEIAAEVFTAETRLSYTFRSQSVLTEEPHATFT